MDFIDLKARQKRIKEQLDANIQRVLAHGSYIMGPEVKELERQLAAHIGSKHAVACASGTDALLMALMAYNVGPGDAIFTTPFTFIATAASSACPCTRISPLRIKQRSWKRLAGNAVKIL